MLEDALLDTSGDLYAKVSDLSGDLGSTGQLIENNLYTTGQSFETSINNLSGDSTSSFVSLSHDIGVIDNRLPIQGSVEIPTGVDNTGVLFSSVNSLASFTSPPHVILSARFDPSSPYIYGVSYHTISNTGVLIDFSATILEAGHFLDFSLSRL